MKTSSPVTDFDLNDLRNATRDLMGMEFVTEAVGNELSAMYLAYIGLLHNLARLCKAGSKRRQRSAVHRVYSAPCARMIAYIFGNRRGAVGPLSWEEIKFEAANVFIAKPVEERVITTQREKSSEGIRWTCAFGGRARGGQRLVHDIIFAAVGPSRFEYARRGRGREAAIRRVICSMNSKGVRWFGLMDVEAFFPSITRGMVSEALGFLPEALINATVFIHDDTEIRMKRPYKDDKEHSSAQAIRQGLPQGSLVSTLVASKVLERHLNKLAAECIVAHVDNVLIGGRTEVETTAMVDALAASLKAGPAGSLHLTGAISKISDPTMNFLGYRLRWLWFRYGTGGRASFSEQSRKRFHARVGLKLLMEPGSHWDAIASEECARWVRTFRCWETREQCEDYAFINVSQDLFPLVSDTLIRLRQKKAKWSSFAEMHARFRSEARRIGQLVPRLQTQT